MIDMHSHTTFSDGTFSYEELLIYALKKRLSYLAITDHNNVDAHIERRKANINIPGLTVIDGVEITTTYKGEVIEILGFGFDVFKMKDFLDENVLTFEQKQNREYELILKTYKEKGITFDESKIKFNPKKESSRDSFRREIINYRSNDIFFLNEESKGSRASFARREVYNPNSDLYVDESALYISADDAINIIHTLGGLAFLAHPFAYSENISNNIENILDEYNLDGLECFYTTFSEEQSDYLISLCNKRGLFMTGGSDFHGENKKNHDLANVSVREDIILPWINKTYQIREDVKRTK